MELEGGVILAAENVRPGGVGPVITHVLQLVPLPAGAGTRGLQALSQIPHHADTVEEKVGGKAQPDTCWGLGRVGTALLLLLLRDVRLVLTGAVLNPPPCCRPACCCCWPSCWHSGTLTSG